jgi:ppGpp synthetase/RelA/SpoT-type nucleotidyltranferase
MSRNKLNQLGKRLAASTQISAADATMLEDLIVCHQATLRRARPRLSGLAEVAGNGPLAITSRPKSTSTILDKLRRNPGPLAEIQDLAGFRIVGGLSFAQQDLVASELARRFPADPREAKIRDRRAEPSSGYRAVHVIVCMDGVSIEIQVRTLAQHMWADVMERLGDRLGRQIRYGGAPVAPPGADQPRVDSLVSSMLAISDAWATDPPEIPAYVALNLDQFTEGVWLSVAAHLAEIGLDL